MSQFYRPFCFQNLSRHGTDLPVCTCGDYISAINDYITYNGKYGRGIRLYMIHLSRPRHEPRHWWRQNLKSRLRVQWYGSSLHGRRRFGYMSQCLDPSFCMSCRCLQIWAVGFDWPLLSLYRCDQWECVHKHHRLYSRSLECCLWMPIPLCPG